MINVEEFIMKQIASWKEGRQAERKRKRTVRSGGPAAQFGPYVLFSREAGAGGHEVAELVGKRLGWQVYDREIVDEIAEKIHIRRQLLASLDEQDLGEIESLVSTMLNPKSISESHYNYHLRQVLLSLGKRGRVVIVGRGGCFILPGQSGLSVRLIAPPDIRVQRIAEEQKLDTKKAQDAMKKFDRDRIKYVRHEFKRNISDPLLYDLTINTGAISMKAAAEIILSALYQKLGVAAVK